MSKHTSDGTLLHIVSDHLGTPREMLDQAGRLRWTVTLSTWGVVRGVQMFPKPANEGRASIYPRGGNWANLAVKLTCGPDAYDCPSRFQGQWADQESDLYYNGRRHYDPVSQQYVSPDPIGLAGGERSQGYVARPLTMVDPYGLTAANRTEGPDSTPVYSNKFPGDIPPGGGGLPLFQRADGVWRLSAPGGKTWTPTGTYSFITTKDGRIIVTKMPNAMAGQSAHLKMTKGADVGYAGQATFDNNGNLLSFSNASGHYTPLGSDAPFSGFPPSKFVPYEGE